MCRGAGMQYRSCGGGGGSVSGDEAGAGIEVHCSPQPYLCPAQRRRVVAPWNLSLGKHRSCPRIGIAIEPTRSVPFSRSRGGDEKEKQKETETEKLESGGAERENGSRTWKGREAEEGRRVLLHALRFVRGR